MSSQKTTICKYCGWEFIGQLTFGSYCGYCQIYKNINGHFSTPENTGPQRNLLIDISAKEVKKLQKEIKEMKKNENAKQMASTNQ